MKLLTIGCLMAGVFGSLQGNLQFVDASDPILEQESKPLSIEELADPSCQQLFDAMITLAKGEIGDLLKPVLVGLSAPQIGLPIRVILVDLNVNTGDLRLYVNPEILEQSQETEECYEGCYSTGDIRGIVRRSSRIMIKALDRYGHEVCEIHEGFVARIFQHEIDHLNGIRFPERIPEEDLLHLVKSEQSPLYRKEWQNWKVTILQKKWKNHL